MATRREETAAWLTVSREAGRAAQHLLDMNCFRGSVNRSYYAAYAAITSGLVEQGVTFGQGGNNPGHAGLPVYILNNLDSLPSAQRFEINKALRRLYAARIQADYVALAPVDRPLAVNALRDLRRILVLLTADEAGK